MNIERIGAMLETRDDMGMVRLGQKLCHDQGIPYYIVGRLTILTGGFISRGRTILYYLNSPTIEVSGISRYSDKHKFTIDDQEPLIQMGYKIFKIIPRNARKENRELFQQSR